MRFIFLYLLFIYYPFQSYTAEKLMVGFGESELSVPTGLRLCGTFEPRLSTGVHDPLRVYCHIFEQDKTIAVIAGCDVAMISPELASKVRARINRELQIPGENILIHASETHNAPDYFGEFREAFHKEAKEKNNGIDKAEKIDFSKLLEDALVKTIKSAYKSRAPGTLKYGEGKAEGLSFNRRFLMKDGKIGWNPGKLNPNIVRPDGPVDPSVPFLLVEKPGGEPISLLWGFAMHLAILNDTNYAADYPFFFNESLKKCFPGIGLHFAQLPCCDVIHVDVNSAEPQKGYQWADYVGDKLSESVLSAISDSETVKQVEVKMLSREINLHTKHVSDEQIKDAMGKWFNKEIRRTLNRTEKVQAATITGIGLRYPKRKIPVLLQVIQLSADVAFIGLPGEVAVELGMNLKKQSPFKHTHVIQLSNDWIGYVPTEKIFSGGKYEADVAKIKPGQGEELIKQALSLLDELRN